MTLLTDLGPGFTVAFSRLKLVTFNIKNGPDLNPTDLVPGFRKCTQRFWQKKSGKPKAIFPKKYM